MSLSQVYMHNLRNNQIKVYNLIKDNPGVSQRELSSFMGIRRSTLQIELFPLLDMNFIREKVLNKKGKKGYWIDKRKRIE